MNYSMIFYIIGWVLGIEAVFMIPPCIVAVIYREAAGLSFVVTIVLCLAVGLPMMRRLPKNRVFYTREGFVSVALSWIIMSVFGALPFLFSRTILNPVDALFETVSGFTTTGASILSSVEDLPYCILFWRSFTHWIGGMGVLVFLLTLLPLTGGGYHMNLMKAESPGPLVSKLLPKVRSTATVLYTLYIALSLIELFFLLIGGMPLFDALTIMFGTAGTGGFGIKNDSMGSYSTYLQAVVTIFMILFGVNFNVYFYIYMRKPKQAFMCEEAWYYLGIIAASTIITTFFIRDVYESVFMAFHHAFFQVGSIITTTGFATTDFNLWPEVPKTILVMLMFVGACAGSTGGGIKVSRLILLIKTVGRELFEFVHPGGIRAIKLEGRAVSAGTLKSVNVFLVAYVLIFTFSVLLVGFDNYDLITNFTAVAATFNNIGPGLELVGPASNFGMFSNGSKLVLIFDMLAGRLEIFPLLLLFVRDTWKRF